MRNKQFTPLGIGLRSHLAQRYEIFQNLHAGPLSCTFGVEDLQNDRERLALELFSAEATANPIVRQCLIQEASIACSLHHPSIVRTYEVGFTEDKLCFVTMELLKAVSLEEIIQHLVQKGASFGPAAYCLYRIAQAVSHAHQQRLLHRDLHPSNVLVLENGDIKLRHFGLSSILYNSKSFSTPENFLGTPFYCAPEEVTGKALDERTDVYALGAIGYELLSGKVPYQGRNTAQVFERIQNETFPCLLQEPETEADPLEELVQKATKRSPSERFQSMTEIIDLLSSLLPREEEKKQKADLGALSVSIKYQNVGAHTREDHYLCPVCKARLTSLEKAIIPRFLSPKRNFYCWRCGSALYWWKPAHWAIQLGMISLVIGVIEVIGLGFGDITRWGSNGLLLVMIGLFQAIGGGLLWADGIQNIKISLE